MKYPGRIIKIGESDALIVSAIIAQLAKFGYSATPPSVAYDKGLASLVKLFQSQQVDAAGRPLVVDGTVGPLTWDALFGPPAAAAPAAASIADAALLKAIAEINVMESPVGSNDGPRVRQFLASVGLPPGNFWCMAFVHWCFQEAAKDAGIVNPFPKTGGCLNAWNLVKRGSPKRIVSAAAAIANPALVKPGFVFILDHGGGFGHTGFVRDTTGGALRTMEGNSNPNGSRNGIGVFDLNRRKVTERELKGFLDFTIP